MGYDPVTYDFEVFKKSLLADPVVAAEYERLKDEYFLIGELIKARKRSHKTQKEVAGLMQTTPSVISRLESIEGQCRHSPKIDTLKRYAQAVGCRLSVKLVPEKRAVSR